MHEVIKLMRRPIPFAGYAFVFFVILFSVSLAQAQKAASDPLAEVKAVLDSQVTAWNAGEQNKAMSVYYESPEMLFVNRTGIRKGYEPIKASYQRAPVDRSRVGTYSYEPLHIERLSATCVFFVIKWKVEANGRSTMSGVSSMVWKRINKKWVIAAEHAS